MANRPVTFSFNGGPGSSSVWLHMGLFGPKRVWLREEGWAPSPPPYKLVENDASLLDVTDLVFIDPVSTGFSRACTRGKAQEFHNFKKDIESGATSSACMQAVTTLDIAKVRSGEQWTTRGRAVRLPGRSGTACSSTASCWCPRLTSRH